MKRDTMKRTKEKKISLEKVAAKEKLTLAFRGGITENERQKK